MKTYKVSIHIEQTVYADDKDEALGIFWDDLMLSLGHKELADELANVEEIE